jgi:glycosyltransferase involved in cell wall biosynthesis
VLLSVVIPCFNEELVLGHLRDELLRHLEALGVDWEVVLVDDGSGDGTLAGLRELAASDRRFRYTALSRNFGKEAAMSAGLTAARGDAVVIMDADLQHPPALLAQMLPLLDQGFDQVIARRDRTGESRLRAALSRTYYRAVNRLIDITLVDGTGDFRLLSRRTVDALLAMPESNRFSKGLFAWVGFDTVTVSYTNKERAAGESKWRYRDLLNYAIDSVLSFNTRPLRLGIYLGAVLAGLSLLYALWVTADALISGTDQPGYVTTIVAVIGFGGLQILLLGVMGEYLGRIYLEAKGRPIFLVKESSDDRPDPL